MLPLVLDEQSGQHVIYLDHSTLSTFQSCKEEANLSYRYHLQRKREFLPFTFGSAIHAGVAALTRGQSLEVASKEFIEECKKRDSLIPLSIEDDEKRSLERGLALLEGYEQKWKSQPYEAYKGPDGTPYVEIPFRLFLMEYQGYPVIFCGIIDAVLRSLTDGGIYIKETKTTTQGLSHFVKRTKPNHQITTYHYAARELLGLENVLGTIWDGIFVSDRKPDLKSADIFMNKGISLEKDFVRQLTQRSEVDIENYLSDMTDVVTDYLNWCSKDRERWPRNDGACHTFGDCRFLDICLSNRNEIVMESLYEKKEWKPWEVER